MQGKHTDCLQNRAVEGHLLGKICTQNSHADGFCRADDDLKRVVLSWNRSTASHLIHIDQEANLRHGVGTPEGWLVEVIKVERIRGEKKERRKREDVPSNLVAIPEPCALDPILKA